MQELATQSRSHIIRYPCPAELEYEVLLYNAFLPDISLAINRACAVALEVDENKFILSPGYDRFEREHGAQNTGKGI